MNDDRGEPAPLRNALAQLLIDNTGGGEARGKEDFLKLVKGAAVLRTEADSLLHSAVGVARTAGATWQSIGVTLGMTKQAAQKRFAPPANLCPDELNPNERTIGPTTIVSSAPIGSGGTSA